MKEYEIWSEGYMATGEHGTAHLHCKINANSFDEAVELANKNENLGAEKYDRRSFMSEEYYQNRRSNWKIWGCALFDNEADARKSFG